MGAVTDAAAQQQRMKVRPDDENEVHDVLGHVDAGRIVATPVARWPSSIALAVTDTLRSIVQDAHRTQAALDRDADGVVRAQVFEEGDVYMLGRPFDGYFADRYLMDFYDVVERDICSRMHLHTGLRYVRMHTGPETHIRVSSLSPIEVTNVVGVTRFQPEQFQDDAPDAPDGHRRTRYNVVVPPNAWLDLQIPRGTSHQFNAHGPNAVIDSVHPEESIETFRELMAGCNMMAQTIFLADEQPPSEACRLY
ncbi:hypothetical protein [Streptomyces chilikensis]|uniref:Uncharacterized protein n=1 Tax=Streptomyces chilikensis TaxID=1194079 RepID=A0ABV3EJA9_9ACTN